MGMDTTAIELSHLRYFVALAEELHFGRAAARLHMAQPPLTRQIKLLEARLQCGLFERTSRSTRLTYAGEQLLVRARGLIAEAESAFKMIGGLGRGDTGHLTVATAPSLMLTELPRVIRAFRKKYPAVDFRLSEMASSVILQAVRAGSADLGFVRGMDKYRDIETHLQWKEQMVAIVPHGLTVTGIAGLRAEPFVFFPRHLGPSFYDEVIRRCRRAGFTPQVTQEARQWSSIIGLVSAGMGVSIGPLSVAKLNSKAAQFIPLAGIETTVRIAGSTGSKSNPALRNFLTLARKQFSLQSVQHAD